MRGAARQPVEDPPPERPDLEAKADRALAEHAAVIAEIRDALRLLPAAACDPQLAAMLCAQLREVTVAAIGSGLHLEEARGALAGFVQAGEGWDHVYERGIEDGRAREREQAAKALIPGPRHRRASSSREPGRGQLALITLKAAAFIAMSAGALWKILHPAGQVVGHVFGHPATWKLAGHTGLKAAAIATAVPAAGAALIAGAVVATHSSPQGSWHGQGAAPAASIYAAVPVPSSPPAALAVVRPEAKRAARGKTGQDGAGVPVPLWSGPGPSSSSVPSSPASSDPAGPAVLTVSTSAIDLSGSITSAVITVTAAGGGWASWSVDTTGSDLKFSPSHGVLQAGQSVTVTVSLAASLDGLSQQSFTVAGQTVSVTLPLPVQVPSAVPVPAASVLPSPLASILPGT